MPYRRIFDWVWGGKRHVMMGASQIDRYGNQNISCIGAWERPAGMLLGVRGAPGNTVCHTTSYWVPNHSVRVFVPKVDFVCGIGTDRARALGQQGGRFHHLKQVVTNLGVFTFDNAEGVLQVKSLHPGVTMETVEARTGFPVHIPKKWKETRTPTKEELRIIREVLDPKGLRKAEVLKI